MSQYYQQSDQLIFLDQNEIEQERNQHLREVLVDQQHINSAFHQMSNMVNAQGEKIDIIDENLEQASLNMHYGAIELKKVAKNKNECSKCYLILLFATFILVFVIILILVINVN